MLSFRARVDAPFRLAEEGGAYRIEARKAVFDRFGLAEARVVGAFLRRDGRLHEVTVSGRRLEPALEPAPLRWHQVVPASLRAEGIPFLAQALGRNLPQDRDVIGLLLEGGRLLHDDASYLRRHDVLQVVFVPLD